jgi:L-ascorbate metabolism protein UlaG (beta-lactamase superfamily)
MKLTWFGTAGFRIESGEHTLLIDPYFTRNRRAFPKQALKPSDIPSADLILITHGHFDHIFDVPEIASKTNATVYCGRGVDQTLIQNGLNASQIRRVKADGETFRFHGLKIQAFFSRHIRFDRWLMLRTLCRIHINLPRYLPLLRNFPEGQLLSWRISLEGKILHHFGSGGSTALELEKLGQQPIDILLVPMQGHTHITRIGHRYVTYLTPKLAIPHHQDNFFPPISTLVDTKPFANQVQASHPDITVQIPAINETFEIG